MGNVPGWVLAVLPPLWIVAALALGRAIRESPNLMARWNERRRDRATIEADQYERLAARCTHLEEMEERCRRDLADAVRRISELEGYNMGRGKAKQDAQRMLSEEREIDARRRRGEE